MSCALCLKKLPLCNSHILPELFYKPIYDKPAHRFFAISTETEKKPIPRQKGIWEKLLCIGCERKLNNWETNASRLFYKEAKVLEKSDRLEVVDIDYSSFKLFQMSMLWRTGVSSRVEFNNVSLGPHSDRLRRMLFDEDPGDPDEYGCLLVLCPTYKDILQQMLISPDMVKVDDHHVVRFLLAGLFWNYFVTSHTPEIASDGVFLSKEGVLTILVESKYTSQYAEKLYKRLKESGNIDRVIKKKDA